MLCFLPAELLLKAALTRMLPGGHAVYHLLMRQQSKYQ